MDRFKKVVSFSTKADKEVRLGLIFLVVLVGFYLRLRPAGLNFWHDEVYVVDAVRAIAKHGVPRLASGFVYHRAFLVSYLSYFFLKLLGQETEVVLRLPVILGGTVSIVIFYWLARSVVGERMALAGAVLLALSPWHAAYSFFLRFYVFLPLLFFGVVFFSYHYLVKARWRSLAGMALLWLVLASLSRQSLLLAVQLPLIGGLAVFSAKKRRPAAVLFLVLSGLVGFNYWVYPTLETKLFSRYSTFRPSAPTAVGEEERRSSELAYQTGRVSGLIYRLNPDWAARYGAFRTKFFPTSYYLAWFWRNFPVGLVFIGAGLIAAWRLKRAEGYFLATFWLALAFLSVANPIGKFQPRYAFTLSLIYFYGLLLASGWLLGALQTKPRSWRVVGVGLIGAALLFSFDLSHLGHYWRLDYGSYLPETMRVTESHRFFPDIKSPVEYVNQHYQGGDVIISLQPRSQTIAYLKPRLNYYLRTKNYQNESYLANGKRLDTYRNVELITDVSQLTKIIKGAVEEGSLVWVISSDSEDLGAGHLDAATLGYLKTQSDQVIQTANYQYAKVYLFKSFI